MWVKTNHSSSGFLSYHHVCLLVNIMVVHNFILFMFTVTVDFIHFYFSSKYLAQPCQGAKVNCIPSLLPHSVFESFTLNIADILKHLMIDYNFFYSC